MAVGVGQIHRNDGEQPAPGQAGGGGASLGAGPARGDTGAYGPGQYLGRASAGRIGRLDDPWTLPGKLAGIGWKRDRALEASRVGGAGGGGSRRRRLVAGLLGPWTAPCG